MSDDPTTPGGVDTGERPDHTADASRDDSDSAVFGLIPTRTDAEYQEAFDELYPEGEEFVRYVRRFAVLLILSTIIAALGLLLDSVAVIIGAMLIAPLMTPILAVGAALTQGWIFRAARALVLITAGTAAAILTGYLVAVVGGLGVTEADLPSEVTTRTAPGLLDLGVAIAAGAAGGYVTTRRAATSALPGVGISVALVPPLATVGICAQVGAYDLAGGALLLFITNLVAIILAAGVTFVITGFGPRVHTSRGVTPRVGLTVALIAVMAVSVPLAFHTRHVIHEAQIRRETLKAVTDWDSTVTVDRLTVDLEEDRRAVIDIGISGNNPPEPAWRLAEAIASRTGSQVELQFAFTQESRNFLDVAHAT